MNHTNDESVVWEDLKTSVSNLFYLVRKKGFIENFVNKADDILDDNCLPETIESIVKVQHFLSTSFERYVHGYYNLTFIRRPKRQIGSDWYAVDVDKIVGGPYASHRGAKWAISKKKLKAVPLQVLESTSSYVDRLMRAVDKQLLIESYWRDTQDDLYSYIGYPSVSVGSRWFDELHQQKRREIALNIFNQEMENNEQLRS